MRFAGFRHCNSRLPGVPRAARPKLHTPPRAMLEHLPALEGKRIVLASASPRRHELLQQMGLQFEVRLGQPLSLRLVL